MWEANGLESVVGSGKHWTTCWPHVLLHPTILQLRGSLPSSGKISRISKHPRPGTFHRHVTTASCQSELPTLLSCSSVTSNDVTRVLGHTLNKQCSLDPMRRGSWSLCHPYETRHSHQTDKCFSPDRQHALHAPAVLKYLDPSVPNNYYWPILILSLASIIVSEVQVGKHFITEGAVRISKCVPCPSSVSLMSILRKSAAILLPCLTPQSTWSNHMWSRIQCTVTNV